MANGIEANRSVKRDRVLLRELPHLVLNGPAVAARAVRAAEVGQLIEPRPIELSDFFEDLRRDPPLFGERDSSSKPSTAPSKATPTDSPKSSATLRATQSTRRAPATAC